MQFMTSSLQTDCQRSRKTAWSNLDWNPKILNQRPMSSPGFNHPYTSLAANNKCYQPTINGSQMRLYRWTGWSSERHYEQVKIFSLQIIMRKSSKFALLNRNYTHFSTHITQTTSTLPKCKTTRTSWFKKTISILRAYNIPLLCLWDRPFTGDIG